MQEMDFLGTECLSRIDGLIVKIVVKTALFPCINVGFFFLYSL